MVTGTDEMDRRRFIGRGARFSLALAAWKLAGGGAPPADDPPPSGGTPPTGPRHRSARSTAPLTLFLCGDVMTGRGLDQVLPRSAPPVLYEPYVRSARTYVELAEAESGPIPDEVGYAYPWGDALDELARVAPAHRVINLETALTADGRPWPDKGIHYRCHPENVRLFTAAGIDACVVANNHVLDWGYGGLETTLRTLEGAGLVAPGAGHDVDAARSPAVLETPTAADPERPDPVRVLVFAFGATSAGIPRGWAAAEDRPGVNLLPDLSDRSAREAAARIRDIRGDGDRVVASIHWGENWGYDVPDEQREFAHALIEEGAADVVHGHSSHHPKPIEVHRDRLILYGCGDFLNDYEGISGHEEMRPELTLMYFPTLDAEGRLVRLPMTPMRIRRFRLARAPRDDARWMAETLTRESRPFGTRVVLRDDGRLALEWEEREE